MRRYLRFSLRASLGGVLLCGVVLGVAAARAERQRAAVAAINRLGGTVAYEEGAPEIGGWCICERRSDLRSRITSSIARRIGGDYFYCVVRFSAYPEAAEDCLPYLTSLSGL
ncbi:MAG: hypothetical protein RIC55_12255 [Pirellulaceae bacterium]